MAEVSTKHLKLCLYFGASSATLMEEVSSSNIQSPLESKGIPNHRIRITNPPSGGKAWTTRRSAQYFVRSGQARMVDDSSIEMLDRPGNEQRNDYELVHGRSGGYVQLLWRRVEPRKGTT